MILEIIHKASKVPQTLWSAVFLFKGVSVSFFGNMKILAHSCHKMMLARVINLLDMNQGESNLEYRIFLDGKNFQPIGARRL